jgi:carboxyl-terminal processing protease
VVGRWVLTLGALLGFALAQSPALDLFDEVAEHLTQHYGGVALVHPATLVPDARAALAVRCGERAACPEAEAVAAIDGLLAAVEDPHLRLLSVETFARLRHQAVGDGARTAFGVVVRAPRNGLGLVVTDVLFGSPAARAGLARGDRVLAVDDAYLPRVPERRTAAWDAAAADGALRAQVVRDASVAFVVDLVAAPVALERPPSLAWPAPGVAWVRVASLLPPECVASAVHRLLREAASSEAWAVVLDLRDDVGGAYGDALAVAGAFVGRAERTFAGPDVAVSLRYERGGLQVRDAEGRLVRVQRVADATTWSGAVVVLVNRRTASCAEVVAQDLQRAGVPIVGEVTLGAANTAVAIVPLANGMALSLSVATAHGPDDRPLPDRVVPDLLVADDLMALAAGRDAVLEAALDWLGADR